MHPKPETDRAETGAEALPQERIIEFLKGLKPSLGNDYVVTNGQPDTACDQSLNSDVITTHCAFLIRHEQVVFKVKRAITYSYLDMSTLAERHRLCRRELELNCLQ